MRRRLQVQDLWVIFGKLDKRKGESDESRGLYLNIMEIFAMLLFRSLPPKTLAKFLPQGADLRRYAWTGLNSASPLKQWRNSLGRGTSDGSSFHFSPRQPAARNILFREADPNLGDLPEVQLMCSYCKGPSHISRTNILDMKLSRGTTYCR